jgi:hypothetical protein
VGSPVEVKSLLSKVGSTVEVEGPLSKLGQCRSWGQLSKLGSTVDGRVHFEVKGHC